MNVGSTVFSQLMAHLPWTTFDRIVERYAGDYRTLTLSCREYFRAMAFAQLTYRESLRDIELLVKWRIPLPLTEQVQVDHLPATLGHHYLFVFARFILAHAAIKPNLPS